MTYLTPAARSCHEVRRFLLRKGYSAQIARTVTERSVELGILDDRRFAAAAVEEAVLRRRQAPAKVAATLAAKGVAQDVIDDALAKLEGSAVMAKRSAVRAAGRGSGRNDHPGEPREAGEVVRPGGCGAGERPGGLEGLALAAGRDRLARLSGSPASVQRRLGAYLARLGYEPEVVEEVCGRLLGVGQD